MRTTVVDACPWLAAVALAISANATAGVCHSSTGQPAMFVMTLPSTIDIDPDAPVGKVLAEINQPVRLQRVTETRCPGIETKIQSSYLLTSGAHLGESVYESGIPGIGVRFSVNSFVFPLEEPFIFPYKDLHSWPARLQLVKTGPITESGSLAGLKGGAYLASDDNYQWRVFAFEGGANVDPGKPTCNVVTPSVLVPLGPTPLARFSGPGTTVGSRDFKIVVSCSHGRPQITTAVYGVLMDQSDPTNRSSTLSLESGSTARGVGVQVLLRGQLLAYGGSSAAAGAENRWLAGRSGNGGFEIPMEARYVQTDAAVSPGSANANAVFMLSYE